MSSSDYRALAVAAFEAVLRCTPSASRSDATARYEAAVVTVVRTAFAAGAGARGLGASGSGLRLFSERLPALNLGDAAIPALGAMSSAVGAARRPEDVVGWVYESLLGHSLTAAGARTKVVTGRGRKRSGSFYTPPTLTEPVVSRALRGWIDGPSPADRVLALRVLDPAAGAGAFLLEAARRLADALVRGGMDAARARRAVVEGCLYGVDLSKLAVAVSEACLWLHAGGGKSVLAALRAHLRSGDSLVGADARDVERWFPSATESPGDVVLDGVVGASLSTEKPAARRRAHAAALDASGAERDGRVAAARRAGAFHWAVELPDVVGPERGFDAVIGNPPWIAYAGRAAQPLPAARRAHYVDHFEVFKGYPTLHGLFVERAVRLAPEGVIGLVLPSPVADLDGYAAVRRALTARHEPREPLLEFGQDAFDAVVQPCFALIADPVPPRSGRDEPWRLAERQRAGAAARPIAVPEILERLLAAPSLPKRAFREMGFQSAGRVSKELFLRAPEPDRWHGYPLLEGRDVAEFAEGPPRLFLKLDADVLRAARCRVRAREDYEAVRFVVRQTASYPIAACHSGLPFRNTLLAGFEEDGLDSALMVGLLNSALYRALHLAQTRDARQAAFPQVKIKHLRALPLPPRDPASRAAVRAVSDRATREGMLPELRGVLDEAVFDLFAVPADHRRRVLGFLAVRAPKLGYSASEPREPASPLDEVRARLAAD